MALPERYTTLISAEALAEVKSNEDTILIDCRFYLADTAKGRIEYLQGHIPGAVYLDINHDLSSPVIKGITGRHPLPHPDILASTLRSSGVNNESQIIIYDQSNGAYASRGWWLLRWLGHHHVAVLDGGYKAWSSSQLLIDNQWPLPTSGNFTFNLQKHMTVNMASLENNNDPLIDSREYPRYAGEYEPIDPVAGHIPGAVCLPYMDNNDETGKWKSREALRKRFEEFESSPGTPVFYCGSGVTACHNVLAYKIATGKDARLYPGSWSEWIHYH